MGDTAPRDAAHEPKQADPTTAPVPEAAGAVAVPTHQVNALLANGTREPEPYADVLRNYPAARDQILALLQRTIGNTATRAILQVSASTTAEPMPASVDR